MEMTPLCDIDPFPIAGDDVKKANKINGITDDDPAPEQTGYTTEREESVPPLFVAIQRGDLGGVRSQLDQQPVLVNNLRYGGFTPLHATCHIHNIEILKTLLDHGAKVGPFDNLGNTALHLAVSEGWYDGVKELLQHGATPDDKSVPPITIRDVRTETPLHVAVRQADVTSTSILLQHNPDLSIKDSDNCCVLHLAASTHKTGLIELLMNEQNCAAGLETKSSIGHTLFHAALMNCEDVEESTVLETIEKLWSVINHDISTVNKLGESPLILACRSGFPKVVKFLLAKGADPSVITHEGQSCLHSVCQAGCSTALKHLLRTGLVNNLVTMSDSNGNSPFYFAVQSSSPDCCEILLKNGAHLTDINKDNQSNCSLILGNLPSALQLMKNTFDDHITLSKKNELDPDFSVSFDYSVLISPKSENIQSSIISEMIGSPSESLMKHPLIESFLYIKWRHINIFFYIYVVQFAFYILLHTSFIFMTFGINPTDWSEHWKLLILYRLLHIVLLLVTIVPNLIIMCANHKKYILQWETYSKLIVVISSIILVFLPEFNNITKVAEPLSVVVDGNATDYTVTGTTELSTERQIASVSAFFVWGEFMMLLGRFPELGSYILMFTRVAKSIIKFLMAFLSLIIGFSISFYLLFQQVPVFATYKLGFVKTLMMMTGEIAYSEFVLQQEMPIITLIFLTLFIFMVPILMANLLIGLAVNDIPYLRRQGKIKRLVKEASYLVGYEVFVAYTSNKKFVPKGLHRLLTSKCRIHDQITIKPNQGRNRRDKRSIPKDTLREAINLAKCNTPIEEFSHHADDMETLFKTFRVRYIIDHRDQERKIQKIMDTCNVMKTQIDHLQKLMMKQMK